MPQKVTWEIEDGVLYRKVGTPVQNAQKIFMEACGNVRRRAVSAFTIGDMPVTLCTGTTDCVACVTLNSLTIKTHYRLTDGVLVPVFEESKDSVEMSLTWKPPASMKLHFAVPMTRGSQWGAKEPLLFCQKEGQGGFFKLPLPNVHPDGRVCMGSVRISKPTISEVLTASVAHLNTSPWNTDLMPMLSDAHALFRFDKDGNPLPVPEDWETHCERCNRLEMEELFA